MFQLNSFQVVLASDGVRSYVLLLYRQIQWGRLIASVGLNAGDGVRFYTLYNVRSLRQPVLERESNVDEPGTYIYRVDQDRAILPSGIQAWSHYWWLDIDRC